MPILICPSGHRRHVFATIMKAHGHGKHCPECYQNWLEEHFPMVDESTIKDGEDPWPEAVFLTPEDGSLQDFGPLQPGPMETIPTPGFDPPASPKVAVGQPISTSHPLVDQPSRPPVLEPSGLSADPCPTDHQWVEQPEWSTGKLRRHRCKWCGAWAFTQPPGKTDPALYRRGNKLVRDPLPAWKKGKKWSGTFATAPDPVVAPAPVQSPPVQPQPAPSPTTVDPPTPTPVEAAPPKREIVEAPLDPNLRGAFDPSVDLDELDWVAPIVDSE